jgi:hypothetical protein
METVLKRFVAGLISTELVIRKLSDGDDMRVGNEGSFVYEFVFFRFLVEVSFESVRKIVFLENHFLYVRLNSLNFLT